MNIEKILLRAHSKAITLKVFRFIGSNQQRFDELMKCFFSKNIVLAQRAAWVVGYSGSEYPDLIKKHLKKMVTLLPHATHDAVKRNTLRVMQNISVPRSLQALVFETCIQLVSNYNEPVAVRAFSITVCVNVAEQEPGLKKEIQLVIEEVLVHARAGLRNRALKELKRLAVINNNNAE